jgi:hypothetical protein
MIGAAGPGVERLVEIQKFKISGVRERRRPNFADAMFFSLTLTNASKAVAFLRLFLGFSNFLSSHTMLLSISIITVFLTFERRCVSHNSISVTRDSRTVAVLYGLPIS